MARPTVVLNLPAGELDPVVSELRGAGFETVTFTDRTDLVAILESRRSLAVAIIDGESDLDSALEYWELLHEPGRSIPVLMVVTPWALDRLSQATRTASVDDEYFTRPYSADALRWRVEAMCIRSQAVDDGSGPVLQTGEIELGEWASGATVIAVFNPKGGVGKTTIATNLGSALVLRRGQRVLLVDADTVTGHVTTSLGLEAVPSVVDAWLEAAPGEAPATFADVAAVHPSGLRVVALASNPLHTAVLEPARVTEALAASRKGFDYVIVDLHPSYSPLNQAIFELADRILVPVTPDVPAIRAAVQLRDVAIELGFRERLALVVNRANSGVSVADMEKTVGMETLALIRSGGMLFVRAQNAGRTLIDMYPKERITEDFAALADRIAGPVAQPEQAKARFPLFGRRAVARA